MWPSGPRVISIDHSHYVPNIILDFICITLVDLRPAPGILKVLDHKTGTHNLQICTNSLGGFNPYIYTLSKLYRFGY